MFASMPAGQIHRVPDVVEGQPPACGVTFMTSTCGFAERPAAELLPTDFRRQQTSVQTTFAVA